MGQKLTKAPRGDYDAIVYIDGSEVVAEDSNGRKIASGVAGTDDCIILTAALATGNVLYIDDLQIGTDLVLPDNSILLGNGINRITLLNTARIIPGNNTEINNTIIKLDISHRGWWMEATSKTNVRLCNIEYDGNDAAIGIITAVGDKSSAVFVTCEDLAIYDSYFHNSSGHLSLDTCVRTKIYRNKFIDLIGYTLYGGYSPSTCAAVFSSYCTELEFVGNFCKNIDDNAIGVAGGTTILISNNIIVRCCVMAMIHDGAATNSSGVVIANNICVGASIGILFGYKGQSRGVSNVEVFGNSIKACAVSPDTLWNHVAGIQFAYATHDVRISSNQIYSDAWAILALTADIPVGDIYNISLINNQIHGAYSGGATNVVYMNPLRNSEINGNTIRTSATSGSALRLFSFDSGNKILFNKCLANSFCTASYVAGDCEIVGNTFDVKGINLVSVSSTVVTLNSFTNAASITSPGANIIHHNIGYRTENYGSSTGTGSEQTIAHGLVAIPNGCKAWITYLVGTRYVTEMIPFDATNVYPTVATGTAYNWRIE